MGAAKNSFARSFLTGLSGLLFLVAVASFWIGGGMIHAVFGTDRVLAEMEGIGLAVILGGLGAWAKQAREPSIYEDDGKA